MTKIKVIYFDNISEVIIKKNKRPFVEERRKNG